MTDASSVTGHLRNVSCNISAPEPRHRGLLSPHPSPPANHSIRMVKCGECGGVSQ